MGKSGSAEQFAAQAEFSEANGFDSFWLPENHFGDSSSVPAPLLVLAVAAARTSRIRLGTGSYLLTIRHPMLMAEEVAVLDRLSEGRITLGVGRGYLKGMFAGFDTPTEGKRERFEHALERMICAWRGEPVATDPGTGAEKVGQGEPVYLAPRPVQTPHPPVWVAAFGPKALAQAGRLGLPYLASPIETFAVLEENFALHAQAAKAADKPPPTVRPAMRTVYVSRNRHRLAAVRDALQQHAGTLARSPLAAIRRGAGRQVEEWAIVGEPHDVEDQIARLREDLLLTHLIATRSRIPDIAADEIQASLALLGQLTLK
ncbi:MAG: alkanesulfonate monooxygenase SsuD [Gammaproteobacteria bacterium]|jgi:alkanesulfonate monooxygenase SsuD/methylene tetrahydromethanopterin reductase-like flavin-dependent oxidoreductase (luciferase family)